MMMLILAAVGAYLVALLFVVEVVAASARHRRHGDRLAREAASQHRRFNM